MVIDLAVTWAASTLFRSNKGTAKVPRAKPRATVNNTGRLTFLTKVLILSP
jgi:hypothetical protein